MPKRSQINEYSDIGNSPISWNSKKQTSTSRSSCESEYRTLAQCSCEAIWIRRLLQELKILDHKPTSLFCDNQSSIKLSYNPVFHEKSKHFEIDYHFTRQKVENNTIKVEFMYCVSNLFMLASLLCHANRYFRDVIAVASERIGLSIRNLWSLSTTQTRRIFKRQN